METVTLEINLPPIQAWATRCQVVCGRTVTDVKRVYSIETREWTDRWQVGGYFFENQAGAMDYAKSWCHEQEMRRLLIEEINRV